MSNEDNLTEAPTEFPDSYPKSDEKSNKTAEAVSTETKSKKKKASKKSPAKLKRQSTQKSVVEQRNEVDDFLAKQPLTISDRVLVNRFCIEQNKKILLPNDWNNCYKYQVSGNIKDLLEYIHNNIRSRT